MGDCSLRLSFRLALYFLASFFDFCFVRISENMNRLVIAKIIQNLFKQNFMITF